MSKYKRIFVLNEPTALRVSPALAEEIGLNESIVLLQIEYWISISNNVEEGRRWTYQSIRDMKEKAFTFWSRSTIHRAIRSLVKSGYLVEGNFNKKGYDNTGWYALGDEIKNLKSISVGVETALSQNETATPSHNETTLSHNETTIPEITTENTPKKKDGASHISLPSGEKDTDEEPSEQGVNLPQSRKESRLSSPSPIEKPSRFKPEKKKSLDEIIEASSRMMSDEKRRKISKKPVRNSNSIIALIESESKRIFGGSVPLRTGKDLGQAKMMLETFGYDTVVEMLNWAFRNWAQFSRECRLTPSLPTVGLFWGFRAYLYEKVLNGGSVEREDGGKAEDEF